MFVERKLNDPSEAIKAIKEFRQLNVDAEAADESQNEAEKESLSAEITRLKPVAQAIMCQIDPDTAIERLDRSVCGAVPSRRDYFYSTPIEQCDRLVGIIENDNRLIQIVGRREPFLSSSGLALDVSEAAVSCWEDGHYVEAVWQAYLKLERKAQQKLGTEDSGTKLWDKCFAVKEGLEISGQQGTAETKKSERQGVQRLAQSASLLIRNPIAHTPSDEKNLTEEEALEYLSVLSCLSRWLDRCS